VTFEARLPARRERLRFTGTGDLALDVVNLEYLGRSVPWVILAIVWPWLWRG